MATKRPVEVSSDLAMHEEIDYASVPGAELTLQRALYYFICILMLLLLIGSFLLNMSVTKDYLEKQLQSHSQDAATSLGLSLSVSIDARDKVMAERIIDAMFDSGDYRRIVFFDTKGAAIVVREAGGRLAPVPAWFSSALTLTAPAKSAQVVAGWKQLGTVVVQSDVALAYVELWNVIRTQAAWFLLIALIGLIAARYMLNGILKPLQELELQAHEMTARNFEHRAVMPKTRELASVARAMNEMADQLGSVFQDQLQLIESLRHQSFIDALTGLSNREGFDGRLKTELDSQQHIAQGSLILIQIYDFGTVNDNQGREAGDSILVSVASQLAALVAKHHGGFAARRSGADFSVFLPKIMEEDVDQLTQALLGDLCSLSEIKHLLREDSVHIGVACVRTEDTARTLFSKADLALRTAQSKGISAWQRYAHIETGDASVREVRQANEWREILQNVLTSRSLQLHTQSVFDGEKGVLYQQVLSRIETDEEIVVAGVFLPMAERFGLMVPFDQLVVETVFASLAKIAEEPEVSLSLSDQQPYSSAADSYCITLSEAALLDQRFMEWFDEQFENHPAVASKILVEVTEHIVSYNEAALVVLSDLAQKHGFSISIERFGVSSVPFSYLQRVQIDIIKVDHSFIRDIQGNQSNQFFLRSAVQIAHGQNIQVVAVGVESEDEWSTLKSLGVDGAMGYHLERPKANDVFSYTEQS